MIAPAKVNLFLHITGKRSDGYHLLESMVAFADFGDALEYKPADEITLHIDGRFAFGLSSQDNLVIKAAKLLQAASGYHGGAKICLTKNIPVGAGLGGGSSDAAATLLALRQLWELDISDDKLHAIALSLGSDVPVCLKRKSAIIRGIGEDIEPIVLPPLWAALANHGVPLLTADVYQNFSGRFRAPQTIPKTFDTLGDVVTILNEMENMLESSAIKLQPVIRDVLEAIKATRGCKISRMSGSGATCFGLYEDQQAAEEASGLLQQRGWWSIATRLGVHHDAI